MPTFRTPQVGDGNDMRALFIKARDGGRFAEWGGIADYTRQRFIDILRDPDQFLLLAFDDASVLRGVIHCWKEGFDTKANLPCIRLGVGIFDPDLTALQFVRLYLQAIHFLINARPNWVYFGDVKAGSALDQLFTARFPGSREVIEDRAFFRSDGPTAEAVLANA